MHNIEGKNVMITPDYVVGMTDGEGCFLVSLRKDNRIDFRSFIVQAIGNRPLLEELEYITNLRLGMSKHCGSPGAVKSARRGGNAK